MSKKETSTLEVIVKNAIRIPGVKVDRKELLMKIFGKYVDSENIALLLKDGPIEAKIDINIINKEAKNIVSKRTLQSSGVSFAAGIPGGLAMGVTIPADTLQYFSMALKLAQELAYLYGYRDLWEDGKVDEEAVRNELILFLGVMFGVSGSAAGLRILSSNLSKQALKKIPQKALTKTIYYPIIKKICQMIGIKLTKDTFAKSVSKIIPIIGGVVSGGITFISMKPMGNKLQKVLAETINYTEEEFERDMKDVSSNVEDFVDVEFLEKDEIETEVATDKEGEHVNNGSFSIADELLKLKNLLDIEIISKEEFNQKKEELLAIKY
ncbi:SHOCT domain-containing protein [Clostridium gasigenes]|uniref:SHOCT domain-containing protein n=1 Tax=Clostridium gasigenes TaxID=94869 RepID=UPI001C0B1BF1|nr:SHOCT domain-containing protein [Clostridium gasigenes]MBU3105139.1 SHOCT domain-containing protein [Clostridium gasigenes]